MLNTMFYFSMLGTTEMILAVVAVLVLFPGNISKLGQSLGSGIRNFRQSMQGDDQVAQDEAKKIEEKEEGKDTQGGENKS